MIYSVTRWGGGVDLLSDQMGGGGSDLLSDQSELWDGVACSAPIKAKEILLGHLPSGERQTWV